MRSTAEKVAALALVELDSSRAAAAATGIPRRTVRSWGDRGLTAEETRMVIDTTQQARQQLIDAATAIVTKAAVIVQANLEELAESKERLSPSDLRQLSVTAGIWSDKLAGWLDRAERERPPTSPEEAAPTELMARLAQQPEAA